MVQLARLTAKPEHVESTWPMLSASLRFASNYLLVAAAALVVSGLYKLSMILETDAGVFRSAYGQALAVKIFLALLMFGIALRNHLIGFRNMSMAAKEREWQRVMKFEKASLRFFKAILIGSIIILLLVAALKQL